jgi:hypothetical protein
MRFGFCQIRSTGWGSRIAYTREPSTWTVAGAAEVDVDGCGDAVDVCCRCCCSVAAGLDARGDSHRTLAARLIAGTRPSVVIHWSSS